MCERLNGKTPFEFACEWYDENEIRRSISQQCWEDILPRDIHSFEFARWLTEQYRLAMAKGIQIGLQSQSQEDVKKEARE